MDYTLWNTPALLPHWQQFHHEHTQVLVRVTEFALRLFGEKTFTAIANVGIEGTSGVWIAPQCHGYRNYVLFAGLILSFPGPGKVKAWFIPLGLFSIFFLNILRIAGLALLVKYAPDYLNFNHHYTFALVVYGFIMIMWMIWLSKFAPKRI